MEEGTKGTKRKQSGKGGDKGGRPRKDGSRKKSLLDRCTEQKGFVRMLLKDLRLIEKGEPGKELLTGGRLLPDGETHNYYYSGRTISQQKDPIKSAKPSSIFGTNAYQVFGFYRYFQEKFPDWDQKEDVNTIFLNEWHQTFVHGKGLHTKHSCEKKMCCSHISIGTRIENEEDKHWAYWVHHPKYGKRFSSWIELPENVDILEESHSHIEKLEEKKEPKEGESQKIEVVVELSD